MVDTTLLELSIAGTRSRCSFCISPVFLPPTRYYWQLGYLPDRCFAEFTDLRRGAKKERACLLLQERNGTDRISHNNVGGYSATLSICITIIIIIIIIITITISIIIWKHWPSLPNLAMRRADIPLARDPCLKDTCHADSMKLSLPLSQLLRLTHLINGSSRREERTTKHGTEPFHAHPPTTGYPGPNRQVSISHVLSPPREMRALNLTRPLAQHPILPSSGNARGRGNKGLEAPPFSSLISSMRKRVARPKTLLHSNPKQPSRSKHAPILPIIVLKPSTK